VSSDAASLTLIVGAGISFEEPTKAAGFGTIRDKFIDSCEISGAKDLTTDDLSPEQIFEALDDEDERTRRAIRRDLWWLCEAGEPNLNHHAVAKLIACGAKAWTPNFDNMIERAAGDPRAVESVVAEPRRPRLGPVLMKPHGSFPLGSDPGKEPRCHDYQLLFQTSTVWNLDVEWRRQLEEDCTGREVHLFGYRGADPDLTPVILMALTKAREVTWWDCDPDNLVRLRNITAQTPTNVRRGNPSVAVRDLARTRAGFMEESVDLKARVGASGADYKLRYRPSVESKAALAGLLQGAGEARKIRLKGLLNP
jgi:hypothetical protein